MGISWTVWSQSISEPLLEATLCRFEHTFNSVAGMYSLALGLTSCRERWGQPFSSPSWTGAQSCSRMWLSRVPEIYQSEVFSASWGHPIPQPFLLSIVVSFLFASTIITALSIYQFKQSLLTFSIRCPSALLFIVSSEPGQIKAGLWGDVPGQVR